jgi:NADPH:quinone reductase-like Zn-dependent oxidoreductase
MRAWHLDGSRQIDGLRLQPGDIPEPQRGEVLVRMRAASLNYVDLMIVEGRYRLPTPASLVPLSDGAGEVVKIGENVSAWKIGDRVASTFFPRWISGPLPQDGRRDQLGATKHGVLADYVLFDEDALVACPAHLSFEEAATLPCAALTAWVSLTGPRPLLPGEVVLTQGSGGVSIFALQFAKLAGARVIVTTSGDAKAQRLKALGADEVINYRANPDWTGQVKELTAGRGADHIIEIGGAGTLEKSVMAAAVEAQINFVGGLEKTNGVEPSLFMRSVYTMRRISVGSRTSFEAMNRAIAFHRLKPMIDRTFGFEEAQAAYRYFAGRAHFGKVVLTANR